MQNKTGRKKRSILKVNLAGPPQWKKKNLKDDIPHTEHEGATRKKKGRYQGTFSRGRKRRESLSLENTSWVKNVKSSFIFDDFLKKITRKRRDGGAAVVRLKINSSRILLRKNFLYRKKRGRNCNTSNKKFPKKDGED